MAGTPRRAQALANNSSNFKRLLRCQTEPCVGALPFVRGPNPVVWRAPVGCPRQEMLKQRGLTSLDSNAYPNLQVQLKPSSFLYLCLLQAAPCLSTQDKRVHHDILYKLLHTGLFHAAPSNSHFHRFSPLAFLMSMASACGN